MTTQAAPIPAKAAPPGTTRRQREKLRQREEILEAALQLFSEKGYHNVSIHEIAARSDFAIGTIYAFFENKEALYRALMGVLAGRFETALIAALQSDGDEAERIARYARVKGEVFAENMQLIRLYIAEIRGANYELPAERGSELNRSYERGLDALAAVFRSGIRKKRFARLDPYSLAVALDSLTNAALMMRLADPKGAPYAKTMQTMMKAFFGPVLVG